MAGIRQAQLWVCNNALVVTAPLLLRVVAQVAPVTLKLSSAVAVSYDRLDKQFTHWDASLCFVWSRMKVINEEDETSRAKLVQVSVE